LSSGGENWVDGASYALEGLPVFLTQHLDALTMDN